MEFELSPEAWPSLFDTDGRMLFEYQSVPAYRDWMFLCLYNNACDICIGVHRFRKTVFSDGICPQLRPDAWKYLLSLYPFSSTFDERVAYIEKTAADYEKFLQVAIEADAAGIEYRTTLLA